MSKQSVVRPAQIISQGRESASPEDLNLQYLFIELARLDVLLRRQVLLWQRAGQDPADAFRGLYISDAEVDRLLARPPGYNWGDLVMLDQEQQSAFAAEEDELQRAAEGMRGIARQAGEELRLERFCRVFKLTAFEREVLLVCLAPMLDPRYERLYGYLQDDVTRKQPGVDLVLALLCSTSRERFTRWAHFTPEAALLKNHLLEYTPEKRHGSLLSQTLAADATVVSWLLGAYRPDLRLAPGMHLDNATAEISSQGCGEKISECLQADLDDLPVLSFYGMDRLGQKNAAHDLAGRFERPLITFDLEVWEQDELTLETALQFAMRDARMLGAVLFITGMEKILGENGQPLQRAFTDLIHYPGALILASRTPWQVKSRDHERRMLWFDFPIPDFIQRRRLWADFSKMGERELSEIAGQFQLTSAQIRDACASARDAAAQHGESLSESHLFAAARAHSNPRLANLARKIQPRYTWQDIILPDDQLRLLREIVATVRGRPRVLDEWGVGLKLASSRGVTVLFAGPPGTGKTMAAEVIAADLKLDLYKIDLATVVSKYIGETEKNLERIFAEAEMSNAILFFDEADALFGKRSEVRDSHDRYANIEISYLLQRMEAYDGVTILATNLGANLDEAFKRRLGFAVEFPFPEANYRNRIWRTLFPEQVPRDAAIDWDWLADRLRLAGGNIRNIIVNAAYLAASDGGVVGMKHLQHSARRELQKMGRLITEDDLTHE